MLDLWPAVRTMLNDYVSSKYWRTHVEGVEGYINRSGQLTLRAADPLKVHCLERDFARVVQSCADSIAGRKVEIIYDQTGLFDTLPSKAATGGQLGSGRVADAPGARNTPVQGSGGDARPVVADSFAASPEPWGEEGVDLRDQLSLFDFGNGASSSVELVESVQDEAAFRLNAEMAPAQPARTPHLQQQRAASEAMPTLEESYAAVGLNPAFTFDTYVVGSSNQFAASAAQAVSERLAAAYSPLFIYGGVGLGKTHLLNAIGCEALRRNPGLRVRYLSGDELVNELVDSLKQDKMLEFRMRTRSEIDLLLVDDIQFIAGKEKTQEEFFHIFNALHQAGRQVVVTSDRIPTEISRLEERIHSRLSMGLIVDIKAPDTETRIAILRRRAEELQVDMPAEVVDFLANVVRSNVRELHGTFQRVVSFSRLTGQPITLDIAREQLSTIYKEELTRPTPQTILKATAEYFSLRTEEILARRRTHRVAFPRKIAMYLCRELTDSSYPEIGRFFDGRDHTTVLSAYESIAAEMKTRMETRQALEGVRRKLGIA